MSTVRTGVLLVVFLGAPGWAAEGQRLAPAFPSINPTPLLTNTPFLSADLRWTVQPRECRLRPFVVRVAVSTLAGAAAGWLGYEVTLGVWVAAEGATPDATVRRVRGTMIIAGALVGAVRAVLVSPHCATAGA